MFYHSIPYSEHAKILFIIVVSLKGRDLNRKVPTNTSETYEQTYMCERTQTKSWFLYAVSADRAKTLSFLSCKVFIKLINWL